MSGVSRSVAKSVARHPRSGVQPCVAVLNERQRSRPSWEQAALAVCVTIQLAGTKADGVADTALKRLGSAEQCLDTAFSSDRGGAERVKLSGGWRMRSVGAWMRWSECSEVHRIHPPERSSAMRSDAERTAALPTELKASGVSRLRNHSVSWHQSGRRSRHRTKTPRLCEAVPRHRFFERPRGRRESEAQRRRAAAERRGCRVSAGAKRSLTPDTPEVECRPA